MGHTFRNIGQSSGYSATPIPLQASTPPGLQLDRPLRPLGLLTFSFSSLSVLSFWLSPSQMWAISLTNLRAQCESFWPERVGVRWQGKGAPPACLCGWPGRGSSCVCSDGSPLPASSPGSAEHPGGHCCLVFTGEGDGPSSFLVCDEMLISLALSKLRGDGPAETLASAQLFLIKFEINLSKRALGAWWAEGQGPEQLPRTSTTSHSPDPWDMCTDYREIPLQ